MLLLTLACPSTHGWAAHQELFARLVASAQADDAPDVPDDARGAGAGSRAAGAGRSRRRGRSRKSRSRSTRTSSDRGGQARWTDARAPRASRPPVPARRASRGGRGAVRGRVVHRGRRRAVPDRRGRHRAPHRADRAHVRHLARPGPRRHPWSALRLPRARPVRPGPRAALQPGEAAGRPVRAADHRHASPTCAATLGYRGRPDDRPAVARGLARARAAVRGHLARRRRTPA